MLTKYMNKMSEYLLNCNDIIIDDTDIINDNNEKYIPKLFKFQNTQKNKTPKWG